jgi:sigma-B regulation protein RsbU (phosphoserine phosphatase)
MDPEEELYGVARLREVLSGHMDTPLDEIQKSVLESVENFARGAHQADDVTLLLVRFRAAVARAHTGTDVPSSSSSAVSA